MITERKTIEPWRQALVDNWKGCAAVPITLEQVQPGDVILARYDHPEEEDSPPREYRDSTAIFVVLKHDASGKDIPAMEIARLNHASEPVRSVSWGTTTLPEGANLWLLGSCSGIRVPDARWMELSLNEPDAPTSE